MGVLVRNGINYSGGMELYNQFIEIKNYTISSSSNTVTVSIPVKNNIIYKPIWDDDYWNYINGFLFVSFEDKGTNYLSALYCCSPSKLTNAWSRIAVAKSDQQTITVNVKTDNTLKLIFSGLNSFDASREKTITLYFMGKDVFVH